MKEATRLSLEHAHQLLKQARRELESARRSEDTGDEAWVAGLCADRLDTIADDVHDAMEGRAADVPVRVELVETGRPQNQDSGGGFGHRALQALALCREAWSNADQNNAPRMERAMAWICRAWLGTKGYEYAHVVRAIVSHRLGEETGRKLVARINAAMAEDSEAAEILRRLGPPLRLVD